MESKLREYRAARRREFAAVRAGRQASPGEELHDQQKEEEGTQSLNTSGSWTERVLALIDALPLPSFTFTPPHMEGGVVGETPDGEPLIHADSNDTISTVDLSSETSETADIKEESWKYFIFKWTIYFFVWFTVFIFFVKIEFGAVFFVISLLVGVCVNTRTKPRKRGEVSAYSVFNKNCQSIDGTLNAEQFEKELRFGPGMVM